MLKHFITILILTSSISCFAQKQKRIVIKYSGFLEFNEATHPGAKIFTRDNLQQIHIAQDSVDMWCDKAIHYADEDFIEAYGNVKIKQGDSINMVAKYVEYSGLTKLAFARGNVVLKDPSSTLTTDKLYFDRVKQQAFYNTSGKVVRDTSGTITSNIGRYYINKSKYQFKKNVKLVNPEYTITSNQLDFYTNSGHAFLYGPTNIKSETSNIYCERGFYNTNNDTGYFVKKSRIDYDNRIFQGDSMYFDRDRSFASASNNIKVTDTTNNMLIKGHYAEIFRAKDSVFITKRALAITVQERDSIYLHADTMMVTGKPEYRIIRAFRNAKWYKSDLSGKADSIHVNHKIGLSKLINISSLNNKDAFSKRRDPILWNMSNQMTGDTIHIKSNPETEKLDSLIVFNNAFLISKDTLSEGYNQIKGIKLVGLFNEENKLNQVDIIKNAESIYYARNDNNELVGIEKSKSGNIKMFIENNEIIELRKIKQVDGKLFPESKFPKNARILRGFVWREDEQPKSVDDLFAEDKPFELPIIKGLKEPIPEDDFFDDDVLKRVEKANKKATKNNTKNAKTNVKKTSKAARAIPKNITPRKSKLKPVLKKN